MDYAIEFDPLAPEASVTTSGQATSQGFEAYLNELVDDPRWEPGMRVLVDHRALDPRHITADDLRACADLHVRLDDRVGPGDWAIVAGSSATYGLARMWPAFIDERLSLRTKVFIDLDDARAWLQNPG